jgi:antagonist of KipI
MTDHGLRPVATVLEPGPFTTVQDAGRFGYRRFGVPVSGALDLRSLSIANGLLGNSPDSPALEIFHGPVAVTAMEDISVSYSGNPAVASVDGSVVRENPLEIRKGSTLRLEHRGDPTIVYLAFAGGLVAEKVMGSFSTYTRAKIGGVDGRVLQRGDLLFTSSPPAGPVVGRGIAKPESRDFHRAVRGPHADLFPTESPDGFFKTEYRVSLASDRMGYRLEGPALKGFGGWGRVLTFPVFPGMVQVTPDGLPIVLMADCQTTGGYPVIAMVLPPDLCALSQKPPGAGVRFKEVSSEESYDTVKSFDLATGLGRRTRR